MKKILLCGAILLVLTTGCGKVSKLENGQDAVVKLKSGDISVDNLYAEMKDSYALTILLDMMDEEILNDKYGSDLLDDEKKDVETQIKTWIESFGSEEALLEQTKSYFGASTMEELRSYLSLQFRRNLAIEEYVKDTVSDKEINDYYEKEIFGDIKASHILIEPKVKDDMTTAEKTAAEEEALKTAKEVITKLKNGEKFEDLAKEYSADDSNKDKGGDLGYFSNGEMEEEFEKACLELKNGEYTKEPVKTTYGYHIILRVDQKEKTDLKSIKSDIIDKIAEEKQSKDTTLQITSLKELREEYKMDIQDDELKKQYEVYLENAIEQAKEQDAANNKN